MTRRAAILYRLTDLALQCNDLPPVTINFSHGSRPSATVDAAQIAQIGVS